MTDTLQTSYKVDDIDILFYIHNFIQHCFFIYHHHFLLSLRGHRASVIRRHLIPFLAVLLTSPLFLMPYVDWSSPRLLMSPSPLFSLRISIQGFLNIYHNYIILYLCNWDSIHTIHHNILLAHVF